jgi:AraC-like DNA-binding protein
MSDFASAAMVRVLAQGMRELGLDPGNVTAPADSARVDLDLKRTLVGRAIVQAGFAVLPQLGRGLHRFPSDPTHRALSLARDAVDLFARWRRLERYIHSRHRCEVLGTGDGWAHVRHVALNGAPAPLPAEDLVVLGVLAALLEAIGLRGVQVAVGGDLVRGDIQAYPEPDVAGLQELVRQGATAAWSFRWAHAVARPAGSGPCAAPTQSPAADAAWPQAARDAFGHLVADLTRSITLPRLADELGIPPRTLQRQWSHAGLSYSKILAEARCRAGAWRLLHTDEPIAEIGFVCGYADQPHFTREMQRRVGMPPAAYRREFQDGTVPLATRTRRPSAGGCS